MRTEAIPVFRSLSKTSITSKSDDSIINPFGNNESFSLNHGIDRKTRKNGSDHCAKKGRTRKNNTSFWRIPHSIEPGTDTCCGLLTQCRGKCSRLMSKQKLQEVFPIIQWAPKYTKKKLISDIIAGTTVGLTILPQGLAYAVVAGLPPIYGLYSGFVGCFVYILFGSTKAITIGPNAIQCILTWKFTSGQPPEYAVFLCFTSGVIFLLMYIFRLGFITNFISIPVISGFTSAVALTIVSNELKSLLGLKFHEEGFLPTLKGTFEHITEVHRADALLSLICCLALICLMYLQFIFGFITRRSKFIDSIFWFIATSRNAIVIIACTIMVALQYPHQPYTIVGEIPAGIPPIKLPPFSIFDPHTNRTQGFVELLKEEATGIVMLPFLGLLGHFSIARAFAGSARVDPAPEILSVGISNLISCLFSSMPIAGSFTRTTVNAMSGAESPAGGFVTGTMVLLALKFLAPYFHFIPKASLASVVCCSVIFMIDFKIIAPMWKSKKMDIIPFSLTILVTLFVGPEYGIGIGLISSTMYLLYYAARPRVKIVKGFTSKNTEFLLVQLDRSLTFPSVDYTTDAIGKAAVRYGSTNIPIVIDCHIIIYHIAFSDFSAATAISDMVSNLGKYEYSIIFWKLKPSILRIVSCVMSDNGADFSHCRSENELETLIDSKFGAIQGHSKTNCCNSRESSGSISENKMKYRPTPVQPPSQSPSEEGVLQNVTVHGPQI